METIKKAYRYNIIIFALEVFAVFWMMSGINSDGVLSASRFAMFKYYTVDSNVLMGIIALIVALEERKVLKGEKKELSNISYILKLIGTVGVTLTMLVTVFYLTPMMAPKYGLGILYYYSNFFLHLVNPILSIIVFICYEKTNSISFKQTYIGTVSMLLYTIYYVLSIFTHIEDGVIMEGYDWYGFLVLGLKSAFIVIPFLILFTYAISYGLWKLNKKK